MGASYRYWAQQYSRHGWTDYKTFYQSDRSRSFSSAGGSLSDILVSDGADIFIRHKRFGADLKKKNEPARHLYAISGFLNDMAGEARTAWVVSGNSVSGGTGGGRGDDKGRVRGVLAYDADNVWPGANLKAASQLVAADSTVRLAPTGPKAKGATISLPAPVVWDGAAAAHGRLYLSLKNGDVACYE